MFKLIALIQAGGMMIVPIFITSVIAVALILEGAWTINRSKKQLKELQSDPDAKPRKGEIAASVLMRLKSMDHEKAIQQTLGSLERRFSWLSTLAAIAPLLGLLGTVSGMIQIFSFVAVTKPTNPIADLSRGISEALVATAGGLLVALISAIGYHYLNNALEDLASRFVDWIKQREAALVSK